MANDKIKLGSMVQDKLTGFVGVVDNRARFLHSADRYCVQPQIDKEGKLPESQMIDVNQLEVIGKPVVEPAPEPEQLFKLGAEIVDPVSGVSATIIGRAVYLNGCARVLIEPKLKGRRHHETWWVPEKQVVLLSDWGKPKQIEPPRDREPEPVKRERVPRTGGPGPANENSKY